MNNDNHVWDIFGRSLGESSRRFSESSGTVDQVVGESTDGTSVQEQAADIDKPLEQELQQLVDRFVSRLEKKNWEDSGYYISDVYACESVERAKGVAKKLAERARLFSRGLIGISIHGDHVHSIHSCAYSNRCCRCSFKNFPEAKEDIRRLLRKPPPVETLKRSDWENITKYFCTQGRRATLFKIDGVVQGLPTQITNLSDIIISGQVEGGPYPSVEDCHDPTDYNHERKRRIESQGNGTVGLRKRRGVSNAGGDGGIRGDTGVILDIIKRYAICPLSEIVYTRDYLEHRIAVKRLDDRDVKNAIDCHASIINTWSREDYVNFYNSPDTVKIWSARSKDLVDLYYLNDEESMNIINRLLDYQCGDSKKQFVIDLINVTDMNIPKCNCFLVVSPPSGGKNFFFDAVKDYYLNVGQMQNPNRYNTFAYQDCHNRRLLIWNEPNYEPKEMENLKMLFGGDNLSANVKCKPQANVKRTPIICMSNNTPTFAYDSAFQDRLICYTWNSAPFLKEVKKKPRPDAVMNLLYAIYYS
nr:MAG: non-structural protein [Canine parvovirus]